MPEPQLTDREVLEYLAGKGVTPAQADRILNDYHTAYTATGAARSNAIQDPYYWLDIQVSRFIESRNRRAQISFDDIARETDARADEGQNSFLAVQQLAKEAAARRRQSISDSFYKGARIDHGPVMDPDVLANTVATGVWTDAEGNYIDPRTGQRVNDPVDADANSIWNAIKGQQFNMGSLAMPGGPTIEQQRSRSFYPHGVAYRGAAVAHPSADTMARSPSMRTQRTYVPAGVAPTKKRTFITPSQALSLLSSMSEDYLTQLQLQMWEAGLYPEDTRPQWGVADDATRTAFRDMFVRASLQPGKNIAAVLADMGLNNRERRPPPEGSPGAGGVMLPDFSPTVANPEQMRQDIDKLAQETLGQLLPPAQRDALVARLAEREVSLQRTVYDREAARIRATAGAEGQPAANDVDAFLAALGGQESGGRYDIPNRTGSGAYGKYQIMPANWPEWSRRAGLPHGSPQTPQNQEIVARQIAMDYYAQFGNWRDVAVAWYSGPGNIASKRYSDRAQRGGPSINDYANSVMNRMSGVRRAGLPGQVGGTSGVATGGNIFDPIEEFDPLAEAQAAIRASDPAGWQATEWANRANEFFGALGSVLGGAA